MGCPTLARAVCGGLAVFVGFPCTALGLDASTCLLVCWPPTHRGGVFTCVSCVLAVSPAPSWAPEHASAVVTVVGNKDFMLPDESVNE